MRAGFQKSEEERRKKKDEEEEEEERENMIFVLINIPVVKVATTTSATCTIRRLVAFS